MWKLLAALCMMPILALAQRPTTSELPLTYGTDGHYRPDATHGSHMFLPPNITKADGTPITGGADIINGIPVSGDIAVFADSLHIRSATNQEVPVFTDDNTTFLPFWDTSPATNIFDRLLLSAGFTISGTSPNKLLNVLGTGIDWTGFSPFDVPQFDALNFLSTNIARVEPAESGGNDTTGAIGNLSKPFLTVQAVIDAAEADPPSSPLVIDIGNNFFSENLTTTLTDIDFKGADANRTQPFTSLQFTEPTAEVHLGLYSCQFSGTVTGATSAKLVAILENVEAGHFANPAGNITVGADSGTSIINNVSSGGTVLVYGFGQVGTVSSSAAGKIQIVNCRPNYASSTTGVYNSGPTINSASSAVFATNSALQAVTAAGVLTLVDSRVVGTNNASSTVYADVLLAGDDTAYDATSWNGNARTPTKNAIRDKFESLTTGLTIGSTTITSGTTGRVLYDNAGTLGEYSTLPVANGGTNIASYAIGDIPYASASTTISKLADVATGSVLISGGVTTAPLWSTTPTFTGTNVTGLPISTGVSGLGTGIATALAVNTGSAGAPVLFNGAGGTPSSITLTNGVSLPVTGITSSTSTALGLGTIELGHATDTTIARSGSGAITVEGTQVILSGAAGGTPSSITLTNGTGLPESGVTSLVSDLALKAALASPTFTGTVTLPSGQALIAPALGTPASGVMTNVTGTASALNIGGSAASLSISGQTGLMTVTGLTSTNRIKTVRDAADTILELGGSYTPTGTWTNLTLVTPALGTPSALVLTNATGTPSAITLTNGTGLPAAGVTGTAAILGANTFTGAEINSTAGAASAPALKLSGVPFAGTGTTSFPLVYINDANATASTTMSTSGTSLGVNAHTGIGNLAEFMLDGASKVKISSAGKITTQSDLTISASGVIAFGAQSQIQSTSDGVIRLNNTAGSGFTGIGFPTASTNSGARIGFDAVNGITIQSHAGTATWNDPSTANSGTVANRYLFGIAAPTLTSTGTSVTNTVASTVYIGGAPTDSTNTTSTTKYALDVAAGNTLLGGTVKVGATNAVSIAGIRHGISGSMVGGAVTVTDAGCTANTRYFFSAHTLGTIAIPGGYYASTRNAGTSFVITSSQVTETSTIDWLAIEP